MERKDFAIFQKWWLLVVAVVMTGLLSYGIVLLHSDVEKASQIAQRTNTIAQQNDRFVDNFSNYMTCLVVNDDNLVAQVGEETYIEICKQLLYRGITPIPETIKPDLSILEPSIPPTTTTTTSTTTSTTRRGGE